LPGGGLDRDAGAHPALVIDDLQPAAAQHAVRWGRRSDGRALAHGDHAQDAEIDEGESNRH